MNKLMVYAYTGVVITMLFWGSAFNAMSYVIQYMPPLSVQLNVLQLQALVYLFFCSYRKATLGRITAKFSYLSYYWNYRYCRF